MNDTIQFWQDLKSGRFASMVKESARGQRLSNSKEAYNVLKPMLAEDDDVEKVYIIFLDAQNKILAIEKMFSGSITAASIYPREIVKRIIQLKASAFVMAHNHPSADTTPSAEDKSITIKVGIAAASIDVAFHDHIIIGNGYYSMADNGCLKEIANGFSSLLRVKSRAMEAGKTIMNNENGDQYWMLNDLLWEICWWFDFFNIAFFKAQPVPPPPISCKKENLSLGHHIIGQRDFGSKQNFSRVQLGQPLWEILVIIVHEMTHAWQKHNGKPSNGWYHNKEFCCKLLEFGIACNKAGWNYGVRDPFVSILKKHGIVINQPVNTDGFVRIPPVTKPKGKSKLKKWSCGCTNVRVAVKDFQAKCVRCGNHFERAIP
jgi:DNA repair protein RadC